MQAALFYQIGKIFGRAYMRATTVETAANCFRKTGLFPLNRHIFRDYDFAVRSDARTEGENKTVNSEDENDGVRMEPDIPEMFQQHTPTKSIEQKSQVLVSPSDIMPVSSLSTSIMQNKSKRSGKAGIVTSTPYKKDLQDKQSKASSSGRKRKPKIKVIPKKRVRKETHRRAKISWESSTPESGSEQELVLGDDEDDDDAVCLFCSRRFCDDTEGEEWVTCCRCFKWVHTAYPGCGKKKLCDICKFC